MKTNNIMSIWIRNSKNHKIIFLYVNVIFMFMSLCDVYAGFINVLIMHIISSYKDTSHKFFNLDFAE